MVVNVTDANLRESVLREQIKDLKRKAGKCSDNTERHNLNVQAGELQDMLDALRWRQAKYVAAEFALIGLFAKSCLPAPIPVIPRIKINCFMCAAYE